jgi:hypothetical protein
MPDRIKPASFDAFMSRNKAPGNSDTNTDTVATETARARHARRRRGRSASASSVRLNERNRPATRRGAAKGERKRYMAAATSAFEYCERSVKQLRTIVAIAATILRTPPLTADERRSQRTMLELLLDTAEGYQQMAEGDRALFEVLVLDARNIEATEMSVAEAVKLLRSKGKQAARVAA